MKRILIAGTKSGVGKTTVSMGLMAALSKKMQVQPFKVGPDYIDSAYHTYITKNGCSNLDSYILNSDMIKYLFAKNSKGKDISVIEGVMGLFDGAEVGSDVGTSASIAKILKTPVILVVDGSKVASSLAATVKGFELFDRDLKISGVIINNVGSKKHYELLKSAIEYYTDVKPCGYLIKNSVVTLPERHLGLVPACEQSELDKTFSILAEQIEETIDLDSVLQIASEPCEILSEKEILTPFFDENLKRTGVKIAIAQDRAFNFYYKDSLEIMSELYGVKWVPFSPLDDEKLPENIDGLYIGGGFPEVFAKEISENSALREDLLKKLNSGLPYIAECGGLMYLCETLIDLNGEEFKMIGWLKGRTEMTKRLQRFGYAKLSYNKDSIKIHEFHRSSAFVDNKTVYKLEKIRNGEVSDSWECGYQKGGGIASYAHFHFCSNIKFAHGFVKKCAGYKKGEC